MFADLNFMGAAFVFFKVLLLTVQLSMMGTVTVNYAVVEGRKMNGHADGAPVDGAPVDDAHVDADHTMLREHWIKEVKFIGYWVNGYSFENAPAVIRDDEEVVLEWIRNEGIALRYASPRLRGVKKVVLAALSTIWYRREALLQYASLELRQDREVVLAALKQDRANIQFAAPELLNLLEIAQAAVTYVDGQYLKYFSREVILSLLQSLSVGHDVAIPEEVQEEIDQFQTKYGCSILRYQAAGALLRRTGPLQVEVEPLALMGGNVNLNFHNIAGSLVTTIYNIPLGGEPISWRDLQTGVAKKIGNGISLYSLDIILPNGKLLSSLNDDENVLKQLFESNSSSSGFLSPRADDAHVGGGHADEDVWMQSLQKVGGDVLAFAPAAIQDNQRVVLQAVEDVGAALEFASLRLRGDREVVLAALLETSSRGVPLLQFASLELRQDREVVLAAVKENRDNIEFAAPELLNDADADLLEIAKAAVEYADGENLQYFSSNREVILSFLQSGGKGGGAVPKEVQEEIDQLRREYGCSIPQAAEALLRKKEPSSSSLSPISRL